MKDVMITVKTVQISESDSEVLELTSEGRFGEKNGSYLITYKDSMMSDEYGVVNTAIKLGKDNSVTITRKGAYNSKFTVQEGKRCNSLYTTPFGTMSMGFYGEKVTGNLNENGGTLELKYIVDINKSQASKNEIYITVREL